jgi:hypothetical protein
MRVLQIEVQISVDATGRHIVGSRLHEFTTWVIGVGEWLASRPGRFTTGERVPGASEPI